MNSTTKKVLKNTAWITFLISFAVYIPVISSAIFGANTSFMGTSHWEYGGSAVWFTILIMCLLIFLPVCLVYQVLYGVFALRRASKNRQKGVFILIASIVALVIIPVCAHDTYKTYLNKKFYNDNFPLVDAYMKEQYSPEVYESAEMVRYNREQGYIIMKVNCDLGKNYSESTDNTMNVYYFIEDDGSIKDNFGTLFGPTLNSEFYDGLCNYMMEKCGFPKNWMVKVNLYSIDLTHYQPGDSAESVYPYCKYDASNIYFEMDKYSDEELVNEVNLFREKYQEYFTDNVSFVVTVHGQYYAMVYYYADDQGYKLTITGYTYEATGQTVDPHEIQIPNQ